MWPVLLLVFIIYGINCEPETVRDNFDYFSYGNEENLLKNLDLHLVRFLFLSNLHSMLSTLK